MKRVPHQPGQPTRFHIQAGRTNPGDGGVNLLPVQVMLDGCGGTAVDRKRHQAALDATQVMDGDVGESGQTVTQFGSQTGNPLLDVG
jgi:hypothetical protein